MLNHLFVEMPHMVKAGPKPAWFSQNFKLGDSLIHVVNFNGNQISWRAFQQGPS